MEIESERITNISELENNIRDARMYIACLKKALAGGNTEASISIAEQLDLKLHQIEAFEFNIERRIIVMDNPCVHHQERGQVMGKSVSINIPEDCNMAVAFNNEEEFQDQIRNKNMVSLFGDKEWQKSMFPGLMMAYRPGVPVSGEVTAKSMIIKKGGQDMQKEECETIIEKTRARLLRVPLKPETLIYTSVFYNACTLAGLGQYGLAVSICKALEEHSDTMPAISNTL